MDSTVRHNGKKIKQQEKNIINFLLTFFDMLTKQKFSILEAAVKFQIILSSFHLSWMLPSWQHPSAVRVQLAYYARQRNGRFPAGNHSAVDFLCLLSRGL